MSRVSRRLNQRVEVWRKTREPDGGGGWFDTWAKLYDARARFSQPAADEQVIGEQGHAEWTAVVYFEPSADVRRNDEIRRAGRQTMTVESTVEPSESGTYLRANCSAEQAGV